MRARALRGAPASPLTADWRGRYYRAVSAPVLRAVRAPFRALAQTFVPEAAALDERGWADVEAMVERFLVARPARLRRQLALLIRLLDLFSLLRHGRWLASLPAERRLRFLESLQDSPLLLLRRGVWSVRTLAFLGYYGRPDASALIGYRADPRGWEARR